MNLVVQRKIRPCYWVLFFVLVGFGLRLQKLDFQPLWGDEGWSFYFATQSLPRLLALTAIDIHPPFYYILLKGWLRIVGLGPEQARFFSVIIGTGLIPVVTLVGWRLFNAWGGVAAGAITALMPMAVYYAQEVRMYGLVTLAGALSTYFLVKIGAGCNEIKPKIIQRLNLAYIVTTAAALYTHYYAILIVFCQVIYIVLIWPKKPSDFTLRSLFARLSPLIYVGLLYLPWVIYAGSRLASYVENKRGVERYTPLGFMPFLRDHIVAFSLGHLPANLQDYGWIALLLVIIALLGLLRMMNRNKRLALLLCLYLWGPLFSGYLINLFYPFTPRFFERTLLLAAPAYWLFIAIGFIWLWQRSHLVASLAAAAIFLVSGASLINFYTAPRYPQEDYRPLLREVAARATTEDTLLASYQWQLGFYQAYLPAPHPHYFIVPGWGQGWSSQGGQDSQLIPDLERIFSRSDRLWFPAYQASGHIWEDEAERAIAVLGYPALLKWYSPQLKLTLAGAAQVPLQQQISNANFENRLRVLEAHVGAGQYEAGRDIVPVQLVWQKNKPLSSDHHPSLRLADATGRTWTTRDSYPQAGQLSFTDVAIGDTILDRHGVLTPAGAPPGHYRLLLSVRRVSDARPLDLLDEAGQPQGAELLLAQIELVRPDPPVGKDALPAQVVTTANFEKRIQLVGYSLGAGPFKAGETLPLTLFWQSLVDHPGDLRVMIQLYDSAGQSAAVVQQAPIWPATEWEQADLLRDPHEFILPPTLTPGDYDLMVSLVSSDQQPLVVQGERQLKLATITTIDRPHVFEAPSPTATLNVTFDEQARLVGIDLPRSRLKAGEMLALTLYWQAVAPLEKNWKVFVHLVNSAGDIVSQQDQIPGAGQFPTTGWLPGEYLTDTYNLPIPGDIDEHPPYHLKIGLYDANDFSRLPVIENSQIIGDHITLESWPILIE